MPELPALEYLNLRSNKIANLDDCLNLFTAAPLLTDLNLLNNPCELQYSSMNILICTVLNLHRGKQSEEDRLLPEKQMKRFCKVEITDVHRLETFYLGDYKHRKEEEERKRKEAEEAAKAEEEG